MFSPLLDIEYALDRANGNAGLAKDLFSMLLQELPERQRRLQTSLANNDLTDIREIVHKLYGATAYCGVPQLRAATEIVEFNFKAQKLDNLSQEISDILQAIDALLADGANLLAIDWG